MKRTPNWPELLLEFAQSGMGVIEFCRLHSLTRSVFYQQRTLARTLAAPDGFRVLSAPKHRLMAARPAASTSLALWCADVRIDVPVGFDAAHLRALLAVLS